MTNNNKQEILEDLIEKSKKITKRSSSDPTFKVWKINAERNLIRIFGDDSFEVKEFKKLKFFYSPRIYTLGSDFTKEHIECFNRDFEITIMQFKSYIEELKKEVEFNQNLTNNLCENSIEKVFISHSSKDSFYADEIIEIIETIGLSSEQIFCSSFEGYGVDLGENFMERLKKELDSSVLVIFILSENFYSSPVSLCEMGATWIKTNEHIPILIPPFDYKNIKGVIPLTQGFNINETLKFNLFKESIERYFKLRPIDFSVWERKRDKIINRIISNLK